MVKKILFLALFFVSSNQHAAWDHGTIHVFGDSHSAYSFTNIYSNSIPPTPLFSDWPLCYEQSYFNYQDTKELVPVPFNIHWVSTTMHVIGKSSLEVLNFKNFGVQNGEIVLLHFGGIDAYHGHIERQYMVGRDLNEIVETLAQDFIETIITNQKNYDQLKIVIMAVLPPCILAHNKNAFTKHITNMSYEYFVALANRTLNNVLANHCKINNFLFFNVNSLFEDARGILRHELSDGEHHVKPRFNYIIKQNLIKLIVDNEAHTT